MIGGVVKHGRTVRDSRNLSGHLLKDSSRVEILNSAAPDLQAIMGDMQLARDGSRADSAFLHVYLSPSRDMSRDELRQAVEMVAEHLGAADHPMALVYHEKPRRSGEGNGHVHAVIGRIGPDGEVLPSGFDKIKLETACRLIEHDLGEAPTLGRHHASSVRWMRQNGREEVAEWLEAAHGTNPLKPVSMASPGKRQGLERQGVDLPAVRDAVAAAWSVSDSPKAFGAALAEQGIEIMPGQKSGVFIVAAGGIEVGSLDRIVKQKRREVAARMKGFEHVAAAKTGPADDREARSDDLQQDRELAASPVTSGCPGAGRGRPDRRNSGIVGNDLVEPEATPSVPGRRTSQAGRIEQAQAVRQLEQIRLSPAAVEAMQEIRLRNVPTPTRFESYQAARELDSSSGWYRLRKMGEHLLERCKQTYAAVLTYRKEVRDEAEQERERQEMVDRIAAYRSQEVDYTTYLDGPDHHDNDDPEYRPPTPW